MDWTVFKEEWNALRKTLLERGLVVQCFFVSENLMPGGIRRTRFKGDLGYVPVEKAPFLMEGKYAFEAFRNEAVEDKCKA